MDTSASLLQQCRICDVDGAVLLHATGVLTLSPRFASPWQVNTQIEVLCSLSLSLVPKKELSQAV